MKVAANRWHENLITSILKSEGDYHRKFIMPRGVGVTTFISGFVNDIDYLYTYTTQPKLLILVPNLYHKNYLANMASAVPNKRHVILTKDELFSEKTAGINFENFVDWLISDNVDVNIEQISSKFNIHVNNSLVFVNVD